MYSETRFFPKCRKFARLALKKFSFPPQDITLEVSAECGLNCPVCFRHVLGVKERLMPFEVFETVVSRLKEAFGEKNPGYISFVGLGEPFCNGRFADMLRLFRRSFPKTGVNVSTSLFPFDETLVSALAQERLVNILSVSADDDPSGHPLGEEFRENVRRLSVIREKNPGLRLRLQTLIFSPEQVIRAADFARENGFDSLQLMRINKTPPLERPSAAEEKEIVEAARNYCGQKPSVAHNNSYNFFARLASRFDRLCLLTDDHCFINFRGEVLPCFFLRRQVFGDLKTESLREIYRREPKLSFWRKQAGLCSGCDIYRFNQCESSL